MSANLEGYELSTQQKEGWGSDGTSNVIFCVARPRTAVAASEITDRYQQLLVRNDVFRARFTSSRRGYPPIQGEPIDVQVRASAICIELNGDPDLDGAIRGLVDSVAPSEGRGLRLRLLCRSGTCVRVLIAASRLCADQMTLLLCLAALLGHEDRNGPLYEDAVAAEEDARYQDGALSTDRTPPQEAPWHVAVELEPAARQTYVSLNPGLQADVIPTEAGWFALWKAFLYLRFGAQVEVHIGLRGQADATAAIAGPLTKHVSTAVGYDGGTVDDIVDQEVAVVEDLIQQFRRIVYSEDQIRRAARWNRYQFLDATDLDEALDVELIGAELGWSSLSLSVLKSANRFRLFLQSGGAFPQHELAELGDGFMAYVRSAWAARHQSWCDHSILSAAAADRIVGLSAGPVVDFDPRPIINHFDEVLQRNPHGIALRWRGAKRTFLQVDRASRRLASMIAAVTKPGATVALYLGRSDWWVVSALACWKSGCAFLPINPENPVLHNEPLLQAERPSVLLHASDHSRPPELDGLATIAVCPTYYDDDLPDPEMTPGRTPGPDSPAYLISTSGTTGQPKVVLVRHRAVANLLNHFRVEIYGGEESRQPVAVNAPLWFDASIKQLIMICLGYTVLVLPEEARRDPVLFQSLLEDETAGIFSLDTTPTQLSYLLTHPGITTTLARVRHILVGGEGVSATLWNALAQLPTKVFNLYGPTECTVDSAIGLVSARDKPNVGRPISNVQAYVLSDQLRLLPDNQPGELFIAGAGLAEYRVAAPCDSFVPLPFLRNAWAYKSGDRALRRADGRIEILGRMDEQIKIRGNRVELGEIREAILSHPSVIEAKVVVYPEQSGALRAIAFAVPNNPKSVGLNQKPHIVLPNGKPIYYYRRHEVQFLYEELFTEDVHTPAGLTIRAGDCIVDVGANVGMASLRYFWQEEDIKVVAVEPLPEVSDVLRANLDLYDVQSDIATCCVGREDGEQTLKFFHDYSIMTTADLERRGEDIVRQVIVNQAKAGSAGARLVAENIDSYLGDRWKSSEVRCSMRTLSSIFREFSVSSVGLLKVDVQGTERAVLEGICDADWAMIRQLVLEVHDIDGEAARIVAMLERRGYRVQLFHDKFNQDTSRTNIMAIRPLLYQNTHQSPLRRTTATTDPLSVSELSRHLKSKVPSYAQPAKIVLLHQLPIGSNGKVDTDQLISALDNKMVSRPVDGEHLTDTEFLVWNLWRDELKSDDFGIHDDFFEIGGDSVMQIRIATRARSQGFAISPYDIFENPTVKRLANLVDCQRATKSLKVPARDSGQRFELSDVERAFISGQVIRGQ